MNGVHQGMLGDSHDDSEFRVTSDRLRGGGTFKDVFYFVVQVLKERDFPYSNIKMLASARLVV